MLSVAGIGVVVLTAVAIGCGGDAPRLAGGDPPRLALSADSVMFADATIDRVAADGGVQRIEVTNIGGDSAAVTLALEGDSDFVIQGTTCATLASGAACEVVIQFAPHTLGGRTADLVVSGGTSSVAARLVGIAVPEPGLSFAGSAGCL